MRRIAMNAHPHNAVLSHYLAEPVPLIPRQDCVYKIVTSCGTHVIEVLADAAGGEESPYAHESVGVAIEVGCRPAPPGYHCGEGENLQAEDREGDIGAGQEGHPVFVGAVWDGDYHDDENLGEDVAKGH